MYVICTAGHVDHGKSTLVQALTGIDPDRLAEEKQRGMTIDLGFAWVMLPSGREVSIVDVPGHERFIKNMLSGIGGVDLALLIVAADESVMPQTREHLAILDLLGVRRSIVVITKCDLVEADLVSLVQLEVEDLLRATTLTESPIYPVSAATGTGIAELSAAIDHALDATERRKDLGRPRLPVDRVFTIAGFGTVATGTLIDGTLEVGQALEVVPGHIESRIRGLQSHQKKISSAAPGNRVAVNLGGVSAHEIVRGQVITTPGWLKPTRAVDVSLRMLDDAPWPLRHNYPASFHAFAAETMAKVRLLDREDVPPGEEAWAQLRLENPIALVRGDYFVIRSSEATLGGGFIVDTDAKRHRRHNNATLERLQRLSAGSPTAQLLSALERQEPAEVIAIAKRANISESEALTLTAEAVTEGSVVALGDSLALTTQLYTHATWLRLSQRAQQALAAYHKRQPLRAGMTREELRSRLSLPGNLAQLILTKLGQAGALVDLKGLLRLPDHDVTASDQQEAEMSRFIALIENDPFPSEAPRLPPELLALLIARGQVVRAPQGVMFATTTYEQIKAQVVERVRVNGKITVAEVRDLLGTSRKYALALLERLDEEKVTRRLGDERVLLQA